MENLKRNHDKQATEKDKDIKSLESQKSQCEQMYSINQTKVNELDTEKKKEISSVQNEIKKLEEDIEAIKAKMKSKENNPHY